MNPDVVLGNQLAKGRGRPLGSKNKLGRDFNEACEEITRRGYTHPVLRMMEIANDESVSEPRRDTMLLAAASYLCPKPKVKIDVRSEIPQLTTAEDGENLLAILIAELGSELEPLELATFIRAFIRAKRDGQELELKQIEAGTSKEQTIRIAGGLPEIPGTNVIMPGTENTRFNGHSEATQITPPNGSEP
jgi:hypothetical protein